MEKLEVLVNKRREMKRNFIGGLCCAVGLLAIPITQMQKANAEPPAICGASHLHYPYSGVVIKDYNEAQAYPLTWESRDVTDNGSFTTYHHYWNQRNCWEQNF